MKIQGYRLHGYPKKYYPTKTQKLNFGLYFSNDENKTLINKYDFNEIPYNEFPGFENKKYHKLFVQAVVNTWKAELGSIKEWKQFVYFDFIHLGTDTYCENPSIIIDNQELKSKLYFKFDVEDLHEGINFSNYSNFIVGNTNSSCNMLDFLKIWVAKNIK